MVSVDASVLELFAHLREPRPAPHGRGLTRAELEAFLAQMDERHRCLYRLVLGAGLRDEEVRHLEPGDVRAGAIMVTPKPGWATKSYRYREIPCSAETVAAAREYLERRARGEIAKSQRWIWELAQRGCEAAGIQSFSLHDLRRAYASHLLEAGFKLHEISALLGHADLITTQRYLRLVRPQVDRS